MRRLVLRLLTSFGLSLQTWLLLFILLGSPAALAAQEPPAGFTPLFNGKDLSGWDFLNCKKEDWAIEDGVLSTRKSVLRDDWILTQSYFDDFELRLEYLVTKEGVSGVAIRSAGFSPSDSGIKLQLLDDAAYPKIKPEQTTGALWGLVAPMKSAAKPLGEWNSLHVTVNGRKLRVAINEVTVQDVDLYDLGKANPGHAGFHREAGHIGLQTRFGVVKFRNVVVKPLNKPLDEPTQGPTITLDPGIHSGTMWGVFFRDEGKQLVTVGDDHTVRLWEVADKELRQVEVIHPPGFGPLHNAELSRDGTLLAFSTQYAEKGQSHWVVYVLSLPERRVVRHFRSDYTKPYQLRDARLAFSGDGKRFAATAHNQPISVWDLSTDTPPVKIATGVPYAYGRLAFSPDGKRIAWVSSGGGTVAKVGSIFDAATGEKVGEFRGSIRVAWSPDGKTIAATDGKAIYIHDSDGKLQHTFEVKPLHYDQWQSFAFSPDSKWLLVSGGHGTFLFDLPKKLQKEALPQERPYGGHPLFAHFSSDSKWIATAAINGEGENWILVRDALTGEVRSRILGRGMFARGFWIDEARWSKDGQAVCWKDAKVTEFPDGHPVRKDPDLQQATFHLGKLELLPTLKASESVSGRVLKRDGLELQQPDPKRYWEWDLLRDGKSIASLHKEARVPAIAFPTFVAGDRIAAVSDPLHLFDRSGKLIRSFAGGYREAFSSVVPSPSPDGRFLMTHRWDRALYIWSLEQKHPLLTLYRNGQDWIIWTQEGYYAATPGGERLVGWKVDNGIDKMPSVYTAERFREKLHRPDVIKKAFELGSIAAALKALEGAQAKPAELETLLPPKAKLELLAKSERKVTVKASAEGNKTQPVKALRLLLDGRSFPDGQYSHEVKPGDKPEVVWKDIELPPGKHELKLLVRGPDTADVSEPLVIPVPVPVGLRPRLHLVCVGINDYADKQLNLKAAENDATSVFEAFAKHCAGKDNRFGQVTGDKPLLNAKREAVLKALGDVRAVHKAKPGDLLVFFFAGHGVRDDKTGEFFLLTQEANTKNLAKTAISGKELHALLKGMPCQVLLIFDACQSAAGLQTFSPATDALTRKASDDEAAATVLVAAMAHESAIEKENHGLFTRALTKALEAPAGLGYDPYEQTVFVHHLFAFVYAEVRNASKGRQNPAFLPPWTAPPLAIRTAPERSASKP
jgi:WD40 repeat protein